MEFYFKIQISSTFGHLEFNPYIYAMKSLKETFIIVDVIYTSLSSFFTDNVSFDKDALDKRCVVMNEEFNANLVASFKKSKKKNPTKPTFYVKFNVMTLSEATEKFHSECADMYTEHDESY